jgi:hypothetical protein
MPIHGKHSNGTQIITVVEDAVKIVYSSGSPTYKGHLAFKLTTTTLDISSMDDEPQRQKLGAFLIWICANTASFNRKTQIRALGTARTAMPFYRAMGFAPDPTELANAAGVLHGLEEAPPAESMVSTWIGQTGGVLNAAYAACQGWRKVA